MTVALLRDIGLLTVDCKYATEYALLLYNAPGYRSTTAADVDEYTRPWPLSFWIFPDRSFTANVQCADVDGFIYRQATNGNEYAC